MKLDLLNALGNYFRRIRSPSKIKPFLDPKYPLPTLDFPTSQVCTENQFFTDTYNDWCMEMRQEPRLHRKQWEYVFILQVLYSNNMLTSGRKGLGFGVGKEPLPAITVSRGCSLVVSNLDRDLAFREGWIQSNQYADELSDLNYRGICDLEEFKRKVVYHSIDMNSIPSQFMQHEYDFVWSSCALDHLGSIDHGVDFILNSLRCLKIGGVAVHTTEYNVTSNWDTIDHSHTVLFRRRDIESLQKAVRDMGCRMSFNPNIGTGTYDICYDSPPFVPAPHIKLKLGNYVSTSVGLVIENAGR